MCAHSTNVLLQVCGLYSHVLVLRIYSIEFWDHLNINENVNMLVKEVFFVYYIDYIRKKVYFAHATVLQVHTYIWMNDKQPILKLLFLSQLKTEPYPFATNPDRDQPKHLYSYHGLHCSLFNRYIFNEIHKSRVGQ